MLPHFPTAQWLHEDVGHHCLHGVIDKQPQMRWNCRSMCFILTECCPSLDGAIADWLLQWSIVGADSSLMISPMKACNHRASFVAWVAAMYSTLVVESATRGCFFKLQLPTPLLIRKAYPRLSVGGTVRHGQHLCTQQSWCQLHHR